MKDPSELFRSALRECFQDHCWASSWDSFEGFLRSFVDRLSTDDRKLLRRQWAEAIVKGTMTAAEYHEITRSDHVDPGDEEQLRDWLTTCWEIFWHDGRAPAEFAP